MKNLDRIVRLGICTIPSKHDEPIQYYRGWGPLTELARTDPNLRLIPLDATSSTSWLDAAQVDGVFMARPWGPSFLEIARRFTMSCKWLWVDYDDNYFCLPANVPDQLRRQYPQQDHAATLQIARMARQLTVSTPELMNVFCSYGIKTAEVLPNGINNWWYDRVLHKPGNPTALTVLWRGGVTALENLDGYLPELAQVNELAKTDRNIPALLWVFQGATSYRFQDRLARHGFDMSQVRFLDWDTIPSCFTTTMGACPDIVIVPSLEHPFNRARSCTAWMEGAMSGAVTLVPDWSSWEGLTGCEHYTPKSYPEEFSSSFIEGLLKLLRMNYSDRKKQAALSQADVKNRFTWEKINGKRVDILNRLSAGQNTLTCRPGQGMSGYTEVGKRASETPSEVI